jgi:hypothetical protein
VPITYPITGTSIGGATIAGSPTEGVVFIDTTTGLVIPATVANGVLTDVSRLQGYTAEGVTLAGKPVAAGGRGSSATPTAVADGQTAYAWFSPYGQVQTLMSVPQGYANIIPTMSTTAYSASDQLGGKLQLPGIARTAGWGGQYTGCTLVDQENKGATYRLWLFDGNPTVASVDNGALSITASNFNTARPCGWFDFAPASSAPVGSTATEYIGLYAGGFSGPSYVVPPGSSPVATYAVLQITIGTPTWSSTTPLQLHLRFVQD